MTPLSFPDPGGLLVFALNVLLVVTVVGALALMASRLFFQHHPTVRYYLCLIALIAILITPFFVSLQSRWGYSLVTLPLPEGIVSPAPAIPLAPTVPTGSDTVAIVAEAPCPPVRVWGAGAVLLVWMLGAAWGSIRLFRGWRMVSDLTERLTPWNTTDAEERYRLEKALRGSLPPIYTSPRVDSPLAVGLLRPIVLLPEGWAEGLSPVELRQVLLHECAHVAHRHLLGGLVERTARLLFWPHPLVVLLCRQLALAREEVCDNVASQESGATCYARTLLALAQGTLPAPNLTSTLALLGPETSLEHRIRGLIHPRRNRMIPGKQGTRWAVLYATGLVLSLTLLVRVASSNQKGFLENFTSLGPDAFFERPHNVARVRIDTRDRATAERLAIAAVRVDSGLSEVKLHGADLAQTVAMTRQKMAVLADTPVELHIGKGVIRQDTKQEGVVEISLDVSPEKQKGEAIVEVRLQEPKPEDAEAKAKEQEAAARQQAVAAELDAVRQQEEALKKRLLEQETRRKIGETELKKREAELKARLDNQKAIRQESEARLRIIELERADALRNREKGLRLMTIEREARLKAREADDRKRLMELEAAAKAREAEAREQKP